jgi:hypothetical protein
MIYYVKNGVLYTADFMGAAAKRIKGDNIATAFLNESNKTFVITRTNGLVEVINENGLVLRHIFNEGLEARFQGNDILVREKSGRTTLRSLSGLVLKSIG